MPNDSWMELTTGKWNDAVVVGELHSDESEKVLEQEIVVLKGRSSRQPAGQWEIWRGPLRDALNYQLTRHKRDERKEGKAFVFAEGVPTGETYTYPFSQLTVPLSGRKSTDICAVTFAGFDIDKGRALERTKDTLANLGLFSILYTTHSHGAKADESTGLSVDKFRILFPLAEPFALYPEDPDLNIVRRAEWRNRLIGFADDALGLDLDESGCDVNRLFFAPRHPPEATNWFSGVFAGRALTVEDMPLPAVEEREAEYQSDKIAPSRLARPPRQQKVFESRRPILSDGFDLIDWRRDHGTRFGVRKFLKAFGWQISSDHPAFGEARSLCPNDHSHSSRNDTSACWLKDGKGESHFVIFCHHTACANRRTLEHLLELEEFFVPNESNAHFSDFLCTGEFYDYDEDESKFSLPLAENYRRWDPKEEQTPTSSTDKELI